MKRIRKLCLILPLSIGVSAMAQTPAREIEKVTTPAHSWSFAITGTGYLIPNDTDYGSPTFAADHNRLHLEARYNYEDLETGSLWTGYNFEVGDKVRLSTTPMIGGVFGKTNGVAPGSEISIAYKRAEFSTENEFVFDAKDSSSNFFYSWTEVSYAPRDWFRFGLVAQRSKVYHTGLDTQRGFLVGFSHKQVDFTSYVFNAGWTDPTFVLQLGISF